MPLLAKTADQIRAMLAAMTFSQKMLIGTLAIIVVACVVWIVKFTGQPDFAPVFDQSFEPEAQGRLASALKAAGINSKIKDGKVLVSAADVEQARAAVAFNDALPTDFSFGFERVVNDSNIWRSEAEKERMWKVAVENELANVLRRFPGVQDAKVIVDRPEKATFRTANPAGSAAVHLRMKPNAPIDKKLMTAVADWVSGAVRDVPRERVKVVDSTNGRSYHVPSDEAGIPADLLELTKQHEEHLTAGILKAIGHIDNVLVSVSVKVDPAGTTTKETKPDKAGAITPVLEETTSKTVSSDGGAGGEPGVSTNAGTPVTAGTVSAGGTRNNQNEEKTLYGPTVYPTRETMTTVPPGAIKEVSAAINIPRSYFVEALKAETGQAGDAAAVKDFITAEIAKIKPKALAAIGLTGKEAEDKVAVGWYYDTPTAAAQAAEKPGGSAMSLVAENARGVGLGALALVSLGMMLLMMRKAASSAGTFAPVEPQSAGAGGAAASAGPAVAFASEGVVGEAGVADGYLQGMEVDEETLRTQKMVEQVASMVKENPDAAANLVRRWISKKQK